MIKETPHINEKGKDYLTNGAGTSGWQFSGGEEINFRPSLHIMQRNQFQMGYRIKSKKYQALEKLDQKKKVNKNSISRGVRTF